MRSFLLSFTSATLFAANAFAKTAPAFTQQPGPRISFTENKGQVHDQNYKARPDVLYGLMAGNMAVHIKTGGVSYQLYRVDSYKEVEDSKTSEKRKEIDQQTIYRIDLNWLNANTHFATTQDETIAGYSNYYLESCPEGALHVMSYKGVTLKNLYAGIDLHYYEKNGELKHDYIVAPHADYKQIQLQIKGAEIRINKDGTLFLTTPLGKVQEGAPLVYQNGKQLTAAWKITHNILSFEIKGVDPNYELIIDPVTRLWGTYYGGVSVDGVAECSTDAVGNVYATGSASSPGSIIATSGSHQTVFGGGQLDAYLAKFNPAGIRQWATYYGGNDIDQGMSCSTDPTGNIYMAGNTRSSGTIIATPGSHQPVFGGWQDAFLVKFNAGGIRLWGTCYGGTSSEEGLACATDLNGNVYLAGHGAATGTIMATAGSHQPTFGSGSDAYLVKFDPSGVRQWGTFYGGTSEDRGFSCATDPAGDVYLAGISATNSSSIIATLGSHQPALAVSGTNFDAFLVKFNTNGLRQWGTYYGGLNLDYGYSCTTDPLSNVYLGGTTQSGSGTAIASASAHQPAFGAGINDAFLAKFNSSGVRQWGTYYGGSNQDFGRSCATDAAGNAYLAGYSQTGTGTVIATVGSHQPVLAGAVNAFLVKFDVSGARQWGTYYGGTQNTYGNDCTVDFSGSAFMSGSTDSPSGIATSGGHQTVMGGSNSDGFLVKFDVCDVPPAQPTAINGPVVVCSGIPATYSTSAVSGALFYTWSMPGGWLGASISNSISTTPGISGVFTLTASNSCGISSQQTLNVTANPSPTIVVSNGSVCAGQSFTIEPAGANSYSYSTGPIVSPAGTTSYTVTGTSANGCSGQAIVTVIVHPVPLVSLNNGAMCLGQSFTLIANGATSYTYSAGPVVSPVTTTTYSVTGTSAAGCISSNTAVSTVTVNPLPTITISTSNSVICAGEETTLTASGASSYTFNPGGTGSSVAISATITSDYIVTATDAQGCSNSATITQIVDECTSFKNEEFSPDNYRDKNSSLSIFPNPTKGIINLEMASDNTVTIINAIGQIVYSANVHSGTHEIDLESLARGIYFIKVGNDTHSQNIKLIKE